MVGTGVAFYEAPAAMTQLPAHPALDDLPVGLDDLRRVVQGLLVHRDWAPLYDLSPDQVRLDEQNLRSTRELLARAFELDDSPVTKPRPPIDRVLCICRHFALLHVALLRAGGIPARMRCGFSNYFDRTKWYDHWITERWDAGDGTNGRWVRDDPQVDELQARTVSLDFDPYDQPAGKFLTGSEAWVATRNGELDPQLFGIFDMWGSAFIAGNVLSDLTCINKVELLPWDAWGIGLRWGPHDQLDGDIVDLIDDVAALVNTDDLEAIRDRYDNDDRLTVPSRITTIAEGRPTDVTIDL